MCLYGQLLPAQQHTFSFRYTQIEVIALQVVTTLIPDEAQDMRSDPMVDILFWQRGTSRRTPLASMMLQNPIDWSEFVSELSCCKSRNQPNSQHFPLPTSSFASLALSPTGNHLAVWDGPLEVSDLAAVSSSELTLSC